MTNELHVERIEVRCHAVSRGDRAQADHVVVGAIISHHAHGAYRKKHGKSLPDIVVEADTPDLFDENIVGAAKNVELLASDLAGTADGETRAGKRVTPDKGLGQAQL